MKKSIRRFLPFHAMQHIVEKVAFSSLTFGQEMVQRKKTTKGSLLGINHNFRFNYLLWLLLCIGLAAKVLSSSS
jgi:hypothetical protein